MESNNEDACEKPASDEEKLARALYLLLRREDRGAWIWGDPLEGRVFHEGPIDFRRLARRLMKLAGGRQAGTAPEASAGLHDNRSRWRVLSRLRM